MRTEQMANKIKNQNFFSKESFSTYVWMVSYSIGRPGI